MLTTTKEFVLSGTSPSDTNAGAGAEVSGLSGFDWFMIDATLQGATGGTLDVYLQRYALGEWRDWIHFTALSGGAAAVRYVFDSHMAPSSVQTLGAGSSPAIAAGTITAAHPGDKVRVWFVPGSGTSAGALQKIQIMAIRRR